MRPLVATSLRLAFWCLLAGLVVVTLEPIGMRPVLGPANLERAAAYGLFGLVAALAYPRQRLVVLAAVVIVAGFLEFGQGLTASRHGRLADFLVKAGGGAAGWLAACALMLGSRSAKAPERD